MSRPFSTIKKLWIGVAVLALLSPLGLILPDKLKAGAAWGEWGVEEIEKMVGFVPRGMEKTADAWHAPITDYAFKGWDKMSLGIQSLAYIVSAILGVAIIAAVIMLLGRMAAKD